MEPLAEEVGVAPSRRRCRRRGRGASHSSKTAAGVRQRAALDFAMRSRNHVPERTYRPRQPDTAPRSVHLCIGLAQERALGRAIWAGVPETIRIVLPWQRHSSPWPPGREPTNRHFVAFSSAVAQRPRSPDRGRSERRREHPMHVRLFDLGVFCLGRLEHEVVSDGARCQREAERSANSRQCRKRLRLAFGRRPQRSIEFSPGTCRASFD